MKNEKLAFGKDRKYRYEIERLENRWKDCFKESIRNYEENVKRDADAREDVKYSINPEFAKDFDNWDKTNTKKVFTIGTTSNVLKKINIENRTILWDGSKILKIMKKHKEMTSDVIKQVPNILENPIIVMSSKTGSSRITMFGEVYANNKPVLAVLELSPNDKNGYKIDEVKIASAYIKDNAQNLINSSKVLYLEKDKKRVSTFETLTGLQLPVGGTNFNNSISNSEQNVNKNFSDEKKSTDAEYLDLAQEPVKNEKRLRKMVENAAKEE